MPVSFNDLLEQFTQMVLADRVTDTSELFKYDKLVLGEGQGQDFDVPQIGFTNFIGVYISSQRDLRTVPYYTPDFREISADLIFNVFIFFDKNVNTQAIKKILNTKIFPNFNKDDAYLKRDILLINYYSQKSIIYSRFHLRNIIFNLTYLPISKAICQMFQEKHKQNHYIFITDIEKTIGRNLFGFNFSIITQNAILSHGKSEIIHEVMHSIIKYKDDGNTYGSHNLTERESYMFSFPGNKLTEKDLASIVNNDGIVDRGAYFKTVYYRYTQINSPQKYYEETSGFPAKQYKTDFLFYADPIEVGGGIFNKKIIKYNCEQFIKILYNKKHIFLNQNIHNIQELLKNL